MSPKNTVAPRPLLCLPEIINKFEDVSSGFINIYKVLDNDLNRSDIFIPFLNSMLKLQASISFTGNSYHTESEAAAIALESITEVRQQLVIIVKSNLVAASLTDPMIRDCETLSGMIEAYIEENREMSVG